MQFNFKSQAKPPTLVPQILALTIAPKHSHWPDDDAGGLEDYNRGWISPLRSSITVLMGRFLAILSWPHGRGSMGQIFQVVAGSPPDIAAVCPRVGQACVGNGV